MAISTYFNAAYYLQQNPDVMAAGNTADFAWAHYMNHGAAEALTGAAPSRKPAPWFDIKFYVDSYPDLVTAGLSPFELFQHFVTHGISEGRSPAEGIVLTAANLGTYAAENPDLQTAFGITDPANLTAQQQLDLANHFYTYGYKEDRPGEPADVDLQPGQTFTLTTGVDTIVGTSGNDIINATNTAGSVVLGGLDSVDGAAGTDTFNIADTATAANADFSLPAGFSVKNVEILKLTTNGAIGTSGGTAFDLTSMTGLTSATLVAAGAGTAAGSNVKAAGTTDVSLTVSGNNQVDIAGGKAVTVVSGSAGTGTVGVSGKDITSVSVKGGGVATIDNLGGAAGTTTSVGTTMTAVTLDNIAGATAAVKGAAIDSLTVKNQDTALATTITNATSKALTVNVDNAGYDSAGATVANVTVAAGAAATTINVNATGSKSNVTVNGAAAKTLNVTGDAALILASTTAFTKIDGSTSTGNLTLGDLNVATVTASTGSGNDSFALQATAKVTVDSGAGNDTVTLKSATAAGSNISLGAGNDVLLSVGGSVAASTATAITVIDGGEGSDSIAANLINAGNAGQFKNFELLNLDSTTGLDLALLAANNTLTGLTMSSASTTATYQNVSKDLGLTVDFIGDNSGDVNTLQLKDVSGASDAFTITFAADNGSAATAPTVANVKAGTVVTAGVENYSIVSGGEKAWNEITLGGNTSAQTVAITGASNLDLDFAAGFGSVTSPKTGVTLIDGSAATGKLDISVANVVAATSGLAVNGGSAADKLTVSTFATTLTGGEGADTFVVTAAVAGAAATVTGQVVTSITDAAASDIIDFGAALTSLTKADVSTATALSGGTINAYALAATTANGNTAWFQYAGNTYVVADIGATAGTFEADDYVVKLTGLIDLDSTTVDTNTLILG